MISVAIRQSHKTTGNVDTARFDIEAIVRGGGGKTCAEVGLPREVTLTLSYGVSRI